MRNYMKNRKVLMAMSGGVDSSVATWLLKEAGYDVTGVFMCLGTAGDPDSATRGCCSPQDASDARAVAQTIGIPLYVLNLADQFNVILDYFIDEYRNGRTPNPCIYCNSRIKFGRLLKYADQLGIDHIATGHYARMLAQPDGGSLIARKISRTKDQSYALFDINREVLPRILFPLGEITHKEKVREIARNIGLKVHDKPDSQEICFVSDNDYIGFLRERSPPEFFQAGEIVNSSGQILARHGGIQAFTIGQRKGLGVNSRTPLYVTAIDSSTKRVCVGPKDELRRSELKAKMANWHTGVPAEFDAIVQIRYNHIGAPAHVKITGPASFEVAFKEPVLAVTPGQAAVCYDGDLLLGGGWISSA